MYRNAVQYVPLLKPVSYNRLVTPLPLDWTCQQVVILVSSVICQHSHQVYLQWETSLVESVLLVVDLSDHKVSVLLLILWLPSGILWLWLLIKKKRKHYILIKLWLSSCLENPMEGQVQMKKYLRTKSWNIVCSFKFKCRTLNE